MQVWPEACQLVGPHARQRLIARAGKHARDGELTAQATFTSTDPSVCSVDDQGIVRPVRNGQADILVSWQGVELRRHVDVRGLDVDLPISFRLDVQPVLTARGCNAGACHGKARGQNGFQLSLLGFDPAFDYEALLVNAHGRRVSRASPQRSLLLQKPTGQVAHGGGVKLDAEGADYRILLQWLEQGAPLRIADEPTLERIEVTPDRRTMLVGESQQLIVTAYFSDGSRRDVTHFSAFQSSEAPIVGVTEEGTTQAGTLPGEATIMARYLDQIATCHVMIPLEEPVAQAVYDDLPQHNFIDGLVWKKLASLNITPSPPIDDAKFMRRVTLDILGRLPSPDRVRKFLLNAERDKRGAYIDELLQRPEYADRWANIWADLLRPNPYRVGLKAVFNYDNWIRDQFRNDVPYDEFVRALITAQGSTWRNGAVTLFRDRRSPEELTTLVSQLFLGVRLECAKCHHHPFERWSQEDFYSFAAYFARVGRKGKGLSPPISGGEESVLVADSGNVRHPLTDEILKPRPLYDADFTVVDSPDLRRQLAEWITSQENDNFARVMVNRIWAEIMGRGLVEPVDDLRDTNPASNPELLDALAENFRQNGFRIKDLIRTITSSYVYGLSSEVGARNAFDSRNFSRHYRVRLRAEVLLDAISDVTGVHQEFNAMPPDSRAHQIWTTRVSSVFLDTFGRPDMNQDPPCERTPESTVSQALHLMNAQGLHGQVISKDGRARKMSTSDMPPEQIVEKLYLRIYGRFPDSEERLIGKGVFLREGMTRRQATEDLMWALMNTPEFVFKD